MTVGFLHGQPIMSPSRGTAGLRGARFQVVFARSNYAEIGWDTWGFLPHFLPRRSDLVALRHPG
jgi:hypothetical protein